MCNHTLFIEVTSVFRTSLGKSQDFKIGIETPSAQVKSRCHVHWNMFYCNAYFLLFIIPLLYYYNNSLYVIVNRQIY